MPIRRPPAVRSAATMATLLLWATAHAGTPTVLHVALGGSGSQDGSSWANACPDIETASTLLQASPTAYTEVWVAAGEYRVASQSACVDDPALRTATLRLPDGVALRGGFAGTEASPDDRPPADDPAAPVTVLTGDLNCDDGDHWTTRDDNAFHVVVAIDHTVPIVVDRVTITGGAVGLAGPEVPLAPRGAGLLAEGPGLVLTDATLRGNFVGPCNLSAYPLQRDRWTFGAGVSFRPIEASQTEVIFTNCNFEQNQVLVPSDFSLDGYTLECAYGGGAAIAIDQPTDIATTIESCLFDSNNVTFGAGPNTGTGETGARGGGLAVFRADQTPDGSIIHLDSPISVSIGQSRFYNNTAAGSQGVILGGGAYIAEPYTIVDHQPFKLTVTATEYVHNETQRRPDAPDDLIFVGASGGGALFFRGCHALRSDPGAPEQVSVTSCYFESNRVDAASFRTLLIDGSGGAIFTRGLVSLDVSSSTFRTNGIHQSTPTELVNRDMHYIGGGAIAGRQFNTGSIVVESNLTLFDCEFDQNYVVAHTYNPRDAGFNFPKLSGGALSFDQFHVTVTSSTFRENSLTIDTTVDGEFFHRSLGRQLIAGGAVCIMRQEKELLTSTFTDCSFTDNLANVICAPGTTSTIIPGGLISIGGSGIALFGSQYLIDRCDFSGSTTTIDMSDASGQILLGTGSIWIESPMATLSDCAIEQAHLSLRTDATFTDPRVAGTVSLIDPDLGAQLPSMISLQSVKITGATVHTAATGEHLAPNVVGSAIGLAGSPESQLRISNSLIANVTTSQGPSIGIEPYSLFHMYSEPAAPVATLSVISTSVAYNTAAASNTAANEGVGGIALAQLSTDQYIAVSNSIIWNNAVGSDNATTVSQISPIPPATARSFSTITGWTGPTDNGMSAADPRFVDPAGGDFSLAPGSPAIDSGDNDAFLAAAPGVMIDLAGDPRFADDPVTEDRGAGTAPIIDRGAYEYQPSCVADLAPPIGQIDIDDVLTFLFAFNSGDPAADLTSPFGTFDIDDILIFLRSFALGCP